MEKGVKNTPKVQLFISCRNLTNSLKSGHFVTVFCRSKNSEPIDQGQTEVILNDANPDFISNFILDYCFEEQQYIQFKLYKANHDEEIKNFSIGDLECTLGELIGSQGQETKKSLIHQSSNQISGEIIIRVEEVNSLANEEILINFSALNLVDKTHWCLCHRFSPMFYLSRLMENGVFQKVYCSDFAEGTNVNWDTVIISSQDLCNGDLSRPIMFELYDHHSRKTHKLIGNFKFSIEQITEKNQEKFEILDLTNQKFDYRNSGIIIVSNVQVNRKYSFLEYISAGSQINLIIAVDFTSSNGNQLLTDSLHYISPSKQNQYQSALQSVGEILLNYDSDKLVPMFGFGGKVNEKLSHFFPLNFNIQNPSVHGMDGIMKTYEKALNSVQLDGPSNFEEVILNAVKMAESANVCQENQQYFILLILTDGEIHDIQQTIDWIVRGSDAPLSIIIIGVGSSKFTKMKILDADIVPLIDSNGKKMTRDIVQFVPYQKFKDSAIGLAKEVLAEIPREIVNYYKIKGITPQIYRENPRMATSASDILFEDSEFANLIPRKGARRSTYMDTCSTLNSPKI